MTIQEIIGAVDLLERNIIALPPGDPELDEVPGRISNLEGELERIRSVQGPLVSDTSSPPSAAEKSVTELLDALHSLRSAAASKR